MNHMNYMSIPALRNEKYQIVANSLYKTIDQMNTELQSGNPVHDIISLVCKEFNVSFFDMKSKSRKREIAQPRQIAMWLIKQKTTLGPTDTGRIFLKDHATSLHANKVINNLIDTNNYVGQQALQLLKQIK